MEKVKMHDFFSKTKEASRQMITLCIYSCRITLSFLTGHPALATPQYTSLLIEGQIHT